MARCLALLLLALLALTEARTYSLIKLNENQYEYLSNLTQAIPYSLEVMPDVSEFRIPDGQCTGKVKYPDQFYCIDFPSNENVPPTALRVAVLDNSGPPVLFIYDNLQTATIWRHPGIAGDYGCKGDALVKIGIACPVF